MIASPVFVLVVEDGGAEGIAGVGNGAIVRGVAVTFAGLFRGLYLVFGQLLICVGQKFEANIVPGSQSG
jgi:hypothetical protein